MARVKKMSARVAALYEATEGHYLADANIPGYVWTTEQQLVADPTAKPVSGVTANRRARVAKEAQDMADRIRELRQDSHFVLYDRSAHFVGYRAAAGSPYDTGIAFLLIDNRFRAISLSHQPARSRYHSEVWHQGTIARGVARSMQTS